MKKMKRFLAIALTICMSCGLANTVSAKTLQTEEIPKDAAILYQDADVTIYQSDSESASTQAQPRESNYNGVWVSKGTHTGSFQVYNTHTGSVGVTFKVESNAKESYAQMYMMNPYGLVVIYTVKATPEKGDITFRLTNGVVGNYTVYYQGYTTDAGMRVMCWTY